MDNLMDANEAQSLPPPQKRLVASGLSASKRSAGPSHFQLSGDIKWHAFSFPRFLFFRNDAGRILSGSTFSFRLIGPARWAIRSTDLGYMPELVKGPSTEKKKKPRKKTNSND